MVQRRSLFRRIFAILLIVGLLLVPGAAHADPLQPAEFQARILWPSPGVGFIVRNGTPPDPFADFFPVYQVGGFGCDYLDNSIELTSHFGFTGDVTLEVINLPAGVTSQTAGSLTISGPGTQGPSTDLKLTADGTAPPGDFTATLRATSGSIVKTRDLPIRIVDELPACLGDTFGSNPLRPDSVNIEKVEFKGDELRVEATECCEAGDAMLWATVAATGEVIGALEFKGLEGSVGAKYEGRFDWPSNPQQINVISSPLGGWDTSAVQSN